MPSTPKHRCIRQQRARALLLIQRLRREATAIRAEGWPTLAAAIDRSADHVAAELRRLSEQ
jgi:hypothetical protein